LKRKNRTNFTRSQYDIASTHLLAQQQNKSVI